MTPHDPPPREARLRRDGGHGARAPGRARRLGIVAGAAGEARAGGVAAGSAAKPARPDRSRAPPPACARRRRRPPKTGAVRSQPLEFEQNRKIKIFTGFQSRRPPAGGGVVAR